MLGSNSISGNRIINTIEDFRFDAAGIENYIYFNNYDAASPVVYSDGGVTRIADQFWIENNGQYLGVDTVGSYTLDVNGDINLTGSYYLDSEEIISKPAEGALIEVTNAATPYVNVNGNFSTGTLGRSPAEALEVNGNAIVSGTLAVNTAAPTHTLEVTGDAYVTTDFRAATVQTPLILGYANMELNIAHNDSIHIEAATLIITDDPTYIVGNTTVTGKVDISGDIDYDLSHGYMYYYERSETIALTQNVYSKLTNATNNLFTVDEANGITIAGDSITITRAGDYTLWFNFSAVGAGSADAYRLKLYKNGSAILGSIKASALKSDISTVWHIQDLAVGDDIAIYLTNTVDNDDITAVDCSIYIRKEHD